MEANIMLAVARVIVGRRSLRGVDNRTSVDPSHYIKAEPESSRSQGIGGRDERLDPHRSREDWHNF